MADLAKLEDKFREAQAAFSKNDSDANYKKYRKAKLSFTEARVEQRKAEEADPDHPRGKSLVQVTEEN